MIPTPLIILIVALLVIVWVIVAYNRLVTFKNRVREAWSDIEVQLKRRYDLIPNLVEVTRGYAQHERETFEKVTEARTRAISAQETGNLKKIAEAENLLTSTLKSLFALAEAYPDLKASTNFLELQRELTDTEDKIMAARRFYNGNVRDLNIIIESFPTSIVAKVFGFKKEEFFEIEHTIEREAPTVKF